MMDQTKVYGLALSLIVLVGALMGNARSGSSDDVVYVSHPESTTVLATAKDTIQQQAPVVEPLAPEPPKIGAASAIVKYLTTNESVFTLNPYQQWPVASLTKLMTAVIAREEIGPDEKVTVSAAAVETEGGAGSLVAGRAYSREDLLRALLKVSSNDAGVALAEHIGPERFIRLMNERAVAIGMYNTRFFDPTGLSALNQSMVSDLEKLVMHISNRHPAILALTTEKEGGNIHPFVDRSNFLGGKTGFIDEASGNLISLFNHSGRPMLIIVLGSEDRAADTQALYSTYTQW